MTEPPEFDLDIALSAELDGELADYASELDLDEHALRERIAQDPVASDRRAALVTARAALAAPGESLDELTRARLIAAALTERATATGNPHARDHSWIVRAAVAATAAIVVLGGAVALFTTSHDDNARKSAATGGRSVRSGNIGNIGNIDQRKLDELVGGPKAGPSSAPHSDAAAGTRAAAESGGAVDSSVNGFDASSSLRASADQVAKCQRVPPAPGPIRFTGSGAYEGRAAVIIGIASGDRTIVFVVAADDCAQVLLSVSR